MRYQPVPAAVPTRASRGNETYAPQRARAGEFLRSSACAARVPSSVPKSVTLLFRVPGMKSPRSLTLMRTPLAT